MNAPSAVEVLQFLGERHERGDEIEILGYVLSPSRACWFRIVGGNASWGPGGDLPRGTYEVVAFNGATVWSWNREPDRATAPVLSRTVQPAGHDVLLHEGLLAGTSVGTQADDTGHVWTRLRDQRGASYWAPIEVMADERPILTSQEIVTYDGFGNARVSAVLPVRLAARQLDRTGDGQ